MYSYYHIWQLIYPSSLPTLNLYKLRSLFACCIFSEVFHFILILSRYYIVFWKIDSLLSVLHAESFHLYVIKSWSLSLEMQNYPKIIVFSYVLLISCRYNIFIINFTVNIMLRLIEFITHLHIYEVETSWVSTYEMICEYHSVQLSVFVFVWGSFLFCI